MQIVFVAADCRRVRKGAFAPRLEDDGDGRAHAVGQAPEVAVDAGARLGAGTLGRRDRLEGDPTLDSARRGPRILRDDAGGGQGSSVCDGDGVSLLLAGDYWIGHSSLGD